MGFTVATNNGVRRITLDRPEQYNALSVPVLKALAECIDESASNAQVRCVVISGSGRAFCAGADVAEWAEAEANGTLETYGWTEAAHAMMAKLYALPKPVIAEVNGAAVGAGVDLALCCDFRYASTKSKFKAGYTTMAYCPDAGSSWHLPRLIGLEKAKQFLFFDKAWPAEQALAAGLVTEVYEPEALTAAVDAVAASLAAGPTFAYGQTKALLEQSSRNSLVEQLSLEQAAGLLCGRSKDADEALKASIEKRNPEFTGQ